MIRVKNVNGTQLVVYDSGASGKWGVARTLCQCCTNQFVAVFPLARKNINCPSCGSAHTETIREQSHPPI